MKSISALELRAKVGQYLDEAAGGERIVVERAGQAICALVPMEDVERFDPIRRRQRRLAALAEIHRINERYPSEPVDAATLIRRLRAERSTAILGQPSTGTLPDEGPDAGS